MPDTSYPPPNTTSLNTTSPYPPSSLPSPGVPAGTYGPSFQQTYKPNFETSLEHFESGGKNIPNTTQGTSSGQAQGYKQITTGTWKEFGGTAYAPTPLQATRDQQNAIAYKIPMRRWAPETLAYLRKQGFTIDPSKTLGENIAMNGGKVASGAPISASPSTAAPAGAPANIGLALAALNQPGASGQSPMQDMEKAFGGGDQSRAPDAGSGLQMQLAAGGGNPRSQQIAMQAQQLAAQLRQQGAQGLTWGSAPPGSQTGQTRSPSNLTYMGGQPIPMPGTTLNSMGALYGG